MTPQAMARKTEESNARLVAAVNRLAARVNVSDALDALRMHKPNIKNPAMSMLRERELLADALEAIDSRLSAEADPIIAAATTPPPSRRPTKAQATA
jgi:hypothetical protein